MMIFEAYYKENIFPKIIEAESWTEATQKANVPHFTLETLKRRR